MPFQKKSRQQTAGGIFLWRRDGEEGTAPFCRFSGKKNRLPSLCRSLAMCAFSSPMTTEAQPLNRSKTPLDLDFTDTEALSRYTTETGRISPRKYTGLTARQQRHITKTIKRSRSMLLMK
jgi:small subunit ribosomal protein S18